MGAAIVLLAGLGAGLLFLGRKKKPEIDRDLESKMIGAELSTLPEASRNKVFELLLTDNPANDAGVYAGAIAQLTQLATFPFTVHKLTEIAGERFG